MLSRAENTAATAYEEPSQMHSRIDRIYSDQNAPSPDTRKRPPRFQATEHGYFPRSGARWDQTSGHTTGFHAEMESSYAGSPLKDRSTEYQSSELHNRIRQAAEDDSAIRAVQRQTKSALSRSRLFSSGQRSGLDVQQVTEAARLNQVMEGARQRLDVSDEVNLALLASEIVERGLQQPTVFTAVPNSPTESSPTRKLDESGSFEWHMYRSVANHGEPQPANLAWGSLAVDDLRNNLANQLNQGAKEGSSVESSLQQLADTESALRLQHQEQLWHVKQSAALARQAVNLAEQQLTEQLDAGFHQQLSGLRQGMATQRTTMHKLQRGCSQARRLLTAFCGSQSFTGTELQGEATLACSDLQQAVESARSGAALLPELMTLDPPKEIETDAVVTAIKEKLVLSAPQNAGKMPLIRPVQKVLQFRAQLVVPISIFPLKIGAVLDGLAKQLRVADVKALSVVSSEPENSVMNMEIALMSLTPLAHASALASLDVMRAAAFVEWGHISVTRIWDVTQRQVIPAKPTRSTSCIELQLESDQPQEFVSAAFLQTYAKAIGVPENSVCRVQLAGLTDQDKQREALILRQLLESAEQDKLPPPAPPVVSNQLALTINVQLNLEEGPQSVLDLSDTELAGWKVKSAIEKQLPSPSDGNRRRRRAAAAMDARCPGAPTEWEQEIQELMVAKAAAITSEDFGRAHQLKGQIELLQVKAPAMVHLVVLSGWLGIDWQLQVASDIGAALFCEPERITVESVSGVIEDGRELDVLALKLSPSTQLGDPSPAQLKSTFVAQLKNEESRLFKGLLTQHVVYQSTLRRLYGGSPTPSGDNDTTVEEFTQMARAIFEEKDEDMSGEIDKSELANAIQDLWSRLGIPLSANDLQKDVEESLNKFDNDNSGTLDFAEFMGMLCQKPWIELLPSGVRAEVPRLAQQLKDVTS